MLVSLFDVRDYLIEILVIFIVIVSTAVIITFRQTPVFEAGASIIVQHEKEQNNSLKNTDLNTSIEVLQGNVLAEQVITSLGVTQLFPDLEQDTQEPEHLLRLAAYKFKRQLTVYPVEHSHIIRVSFRHQEPEVTVKVVKTLISLFRQRCGRLQNPQTSLQQDEQLFLYRKQMWQAEKVLSMFQQKNRIFLSGNRQEDISAQYDKMKLLLVTEKEKLKECSDHFDALKQQFTAATMSATEQGEGTQNEKDFEEDRDSLLQMKLYEHELMRKYGEDDKLISDVRQQIDIMKKLLYTPEASSVHNEAAKKGGQLDAIADQVVLAKVAYSRQQEKENFIQRQLRQLENKLQRFAEQEGIFNELRLEVENSNAQYTKYVQQLQEERNTAACSSYVSIVEEPMLPLKPIKPKKLRNISLAIFFGLLCSLLYAFLRKAWSGRTKA